MTTNNKKPTQAGRIAEMMKAGWVSPVEAMNELGCMRFGARVLEIKELYDWSLSPYTVCERWRKSTNRWGEKVQFKEFRLVRKGV